MGAKKSGATTVLFWLIWLVECAPQMAQLPYKIGAVAFTRSGWPDLGWYEDAQVLRRFGGF